MLRLWIALLIALLLAACSSPPQRVARATGGSGASGDAFRTRPPGLPNFVDHSVGREEISIQAMSLVGVPYRWGGNTPDSGFDCSGLVHYVIARAASVNLPRTTAEMSGRGESIEPDEIAPGDLIFFNTTGRPHSHVGIYVGKLRFVNAPSTGGTVRLDYLTNPYWAKRFDGIRRVAPPKTAPTPFDAPSYEASTTPAQRGPAPRVVTAVAPSSAPARVAAIAPEPRAAASVAPSIAPAQGYQPYPQDTGRTSTTAGSAVATSADAFEPPPPQMSAAQRQAQAAGAIAPSTAVTSATQAQVTTGTAFDPSGNRAADTAASRSADPIDAAADAFEPPPPAAVAARQAQQAHATGEATDVQVMRASTASRGTPAPTQSGDDPIARFANGNF
ncbi:C40 family peptidase [Paraburkholderia kururiensis]|uniref:NlpC/P60 family protein n=1 Tax=Paraburkholderia kururiensis TaxID=984307 RepID=A0ABZ0WS49_9BURK|nr:C40 family peptidase [Paraburkholderia kururiensis]WQD80233.1 NlpC/P60 family protein [Paraburkholderia kururiensis]